MPDSQYRLCPGCRSVDKAHDFGPTCTLIEKGDDPRRNAQFHIDTMLQVLIAAQSIADLDLQPLINAIDQADTVGALIDPTLYMAKREALAQSRALLVAAKSFVSAAATITNGADARTFQDIADRIRS
jgi:hypothetical protein